MVEPVRQNFLPLAMAIGLLLGPACSRGPAIESEAAVRQALERYLASRPNLNMQGMEMQVSAIKFRNQKAEADVTFRAKNDAKATMSMRYTLRRQGRKWEVEPQASGSGHGSMMPPAGTSRPADLPSGHPPTGSRPSQTPELPAGHPPVKTK